MALEGPCRLAVTSVAVVVSLGLGLAGGCGSGPATRGDGRAAPAASNDAPVTVSLDLRRNETQGAPPVRVASANAPAPALEPLGTAARAIDRELWVRAPEDRPGWEQVRPSPDVAVVGYASVVGGVGGGRGGEPYEPLSSIVVRYCLIGRDGTRRSTEATYLVSGGYADLPDGTRWWKYGFQRFITPDGAARDESDR